MITIFDIDGVLADSHHRLGFILDNPKRWDAFNEAAVKDKPFPEYVDLLHEHMDIGDEILFITGRNETQRERTTRWLQDHVIDKDDAWFAERLFMRSKTDYRPAALVKAGILDKNLIAPDMVRVFYEDQPATVEMLMEHGYNVHDPGTWRDHYHEVL